MTALTERVNRAVAEAYDFGRFRVVVDVGGGRGTLLAGILARHQDVEGVLFDQQHVVAGAQLPDRCRAVHECGRAGRCVAVHGTLDGSGRSWPLDGPNDHRSASGL